MHRGRLRSAVPFGIDIDLTDITRRIAEGEAARLARDEAAQDAERAEQALAEGWADLIGFGRPFIANPDLPERLRTGAALNPPDRATFFGGGAASFTDYPTLEESVAA